MSKKVVSLLLTATMVATLAGCGGGGDSSDPAADSGTEGGSSAGAGSTDESNADESTADAGTETPADDVEKPEEITIMVDGTVFTEENGRDQFMAKLEELTGIKINVIQPDHDAYYDVVGQQIAGGDWPDVLILASTQMSSYGSEGVLDA